jgi:hypothetical protein
MNSNICAIITVLPSFERIDYTKQMLESLRKSSLLPDMIIFSIDGNAPRGNIEQLNTIHMIEEQKLGYDLPIKVSYVLHKERVGQTFGFISALAQLRIYEQYFKNYDIKYVCKLEDDILIGEKFFENAVYAFEQYKDRVAIVTGFAAPEHIIGNLANTREVWDTHLNSFIYLSDKITGHTMFSSKDFWNYLQTPDDIASDGRPRGKGDGRGAELDWWAIKYGYGSVRDIGKRCLTLPGEIIHLAPNNSTWGASRTEFTEGEIDTIKKDGLAGIGYPYVRKECA